MLIVDDHELLAQSLSFALVARGLDASALRPTGFADVEAAVAQAPPGVVLLDLQLGGEIGSGTALVRLFTAVGARVLIVSGLTDVVAVGEAIEAGAVGYVCKSEPFEVLLDAAERVTRGEQVMAASRRDELLRAVRREEAGSAAARRKLESLTRREREVLDALSAGDSVTTIATRSVVSVATVRSQVRAILTKLDVGSQLEAVALAHKHDRHLHGPVERSA